MATYVTEILTTDVCVCVVLQSNYLVFMAELFWWFEVVKPSFVQPRVFDPDGTVQVQNNLSMLLIAVMMMMMMMMVCFAC